MTYKGAHIKSVGKSQYWVTDATGTFTRTVHSILAAKSWVNSGFDPAWQEVILSPEAKKYLATMMESRKDIYAMPKNWAALFLENYIEAQKHGHDWPLDTEVWYAFANIHPRFKREMTFKEFLDIIGMMQVY